MKKKQQKHEPSQWVEVQDQVIQLLNDMPPTTLDSLDKTLEHLLIREALEERPVLRSWVFSIEKQEFL